MLETCKQMAVRNLEGPCWTLEAAAAATTIVWLPTTSPITLMICAGGDHFSTIILQLRKINLSARS